MLTTSISREIHARWIARSRREIARPSGPPTFRRSIHYEDITHSLREVAHLSAPAVFCASTWWRMRTLRSLNVEDAP